MCSDEFQAAVLEPLEWLMPLAEQLAKPGTRIEQIRAELEGLEARIGSLNMVQLCSVLDNYLSPSSPQLAYYLGLVLLAAAEMYCDRRTQGLFALSVGGVLIRLGEVQEARSYCEFAQAVFRTTEDRCEYAAASLRLGSTFIDSKRPSDALEGLNEALRVGVDLGDKTLEASALNNIGCVYRRMNENQEALRYCEGAVAACRATNDEMLHRDCLGNLAGVYSDLNLPLRAKAVIAEALEIPGRGEDKFGLLNDLLLFGNVEMQVEDYQTAEKHLQEALRIALEIRLWDRVQACHQRLAELYERTEDWRRAIACLEEAARVARATGKSGEENIILIELARLYAKSPRED